MVDRCIRFVHRCSVLILASISTSLATAILLGLIAPSAAIAGTHINTFCREYNPNATWECTVHPIYAPDWTYGFPGYPAAQCGVLPGACHMPDHPEPFDTEEEAVAIANDSAFGLAGAVWTRDVGRAHRVAAAVRAGTFWINAYKTIHVASPFGGSGRSRWSTSPTG